MQNAGILVSVCIPVYNGGDLIARAIESCIAQSYKNIEIVVVDNASTDNTRDIVETYSKQEKRIRYIQNGIKIGMMDNFFRAYEHATGEYVQLLCHDDWLSTNYVEEALRCFERNPKAGAVSTRMVSVGLGDDNAINEKSVAVMPCKRYSQRAVIRNAYNAETGYGGVISVIRRTDLIAAKSVITGLFQNEKYGDIYRRGLVTDLAIFLTVMRNYDYMYFTDKATYVKLEHGANSGKGIDVRMTSNFEALRYYDVVRTCLEYLYERFFPENLEYMKIDIGAEALSTILLRMVRFAGGEKNLDRLKMKDIAAFLKGYSSTEKVKVLLLVVPRVILRLGRWSIRQLWPSTRSSAA